MKEIEPYDLDIAFIDRRKEFEFLLDRLKQKPNSILFITGPKSSGKTTLLIKLIEKISKEKKYDIKHFNLRTILISNYSDFIKTFFEIDFQKSKDEIKKKREYNLKVFKLTTEILKGLENKEYDPFSVMEKELQKMAKKGICPIVVIDELQALEDIYMNGQRELLKELFNFFVAITKESHLCHVIIASSDGYFMKRIYKDSKLKKTSTFFEIDYLSKENVFYWLNNLEKENKMTKYKLSESQIETIYKYFGGSMLEIHKILGELLHHKNEEKTVDDTVLMNIIEKEIIHICGTFNCYAQINKPKIALLKSIFNIQKKRETFIIKDLKNLAEESLFDEDGLTNELNELVRDNFLCFDPASNTYKLQGRSIYYGLKLYVETIADR